MVWPAPLHFHQVRPALGRQRPSAKSAPRRLHPSRSGIQPAPTRDRRDRSLPDSLAARSRFHRSRRRLGHAVKSETGGESPLDRRLQLQSAATGGGIPIPPVTSPQPPYSLLHREVESDILPHCKSEGIGVIVYSPMASGLLTGAVT